MTIKSEPTLLKPWDVFEIKPGYRVYTTIPEHCVYENRVGSMKPVEHDIVVGDTYKGLETDYLLGNYICISASMGGGGTGHGPNDVYPDGYLVVAIHSENEHVRISFYQTGAFTAMIENPTVVARVITPTLELVRLVTT